MPGTSPYAGSSSTLSTRVIGIGEAPPDRDGLPPSEASVKCALSDEDSSVESVSYFIVNDSKGRTIPSSCAPASSSAWCWLGGGTCSFNSSLMIAVFSECWGRKFDVQQ